MSIHLERAEMQLARGKSLALVKDSLKLHFTESLKYIENIPCPTCDTLVDDETCPECNGEGTIQGTEYVYPSKDEVQAKVDSYLAPMLASKAKEEALKYLNDTDWVIAKIAEAQLLGEDIVALKDKYAAILTNRVEARCRV